MGYGVLQSPANPHFFLPILPGFNSHLDLPVKFFSVYIEERYERNTVELRSDACEKTWNVKREGRRRLTAGWKEFATAHDFQIGDIIIFRHQGDLVFHVTSFGLSFCEIQYKQDDLRTLSPKQNLKTEPESLQDNDDKDNNMRNFPRKKHAKKRNIEAESFSSYQSCFVAYVTESNLKLDTKFLPGKFVKSVGLNKGNNKITLTNEGVKTWTLDLRFRESSKMFYMTKGWTSFCHENGLEPGNFVTFEIERNNTTMPLLRFSFAESKCVSAKKEPGEGSSSVPSLNRFVRLTATPKHLRKCRLHLPQIFVKVNKLEKVRGKKIAMLDKNGVEWPVNIYMNNGYTSLGSGLKEFLNANGVKAYESFVLEFVWKDTTTIPMLKFCFKVKT